VRHDEKISLSVDRLNFDHRKLLAVTLLAFHTLALLLLENDDFIAAFIFEDGRGDASAIEDRRADLERFTFARRENLVDLNSRTGFRIWIAVDDQNVAFGNGELLALCSDGRFHK